MVYGHNPSLYDTATAPIHWSAIHADVVVDPTNGVAGGPVLTGSSEDAYALRDVLEIESPLTGVLNSRLMVDTLPAADKIMIGFTAADRSMIACVVLLADGTLAAYSGMAASLLAPPSVPLTLSTQLRLGFKVVIGVSGSVEVQVDGVTVSAATGVNLGTVGWAGFYVGLAPDVFQGHFVVSDDGMFRRAALVEYVMSSTASLAEAVTDQDTTYETLAEDEELVTDLAAGGTERRIVYAVGVVAVARALDGINGVIPLIGLDAVMTDGPRQDVTTNYSAVEMFRQTDPDTELPYTGAGAIAIDIGARAVA